MINGLQIVWNDKYRWFETHFTWSVRQKSCCSSVSMSMDFSLPQHIAACCWPQTGPRPWGKMQCYWKELRTAHFFPSTHSSTAPASLPPFTLLPFFSSSPQGFKFLVSRPNPKSIIFCTLGKQSTWLLLGKSCAIHRLPIFNTLYLVNFHPDQARLCLALLDIYWGMSKRNADTN